ESGLTPKVVETALRYYLGRETELYVDETDELVADWERKAPNAVTAGTADAMNVTVIRDRSQLETFLDANYPHLAQNFLDPRFAIGIKGPSVEERMPMTV